MYNVFLEEKRQRERAESAPAAMSRTALKRREQLAQRYDAHLIPPVQNCNIRHRYHTRVESFMRQKQIAGCVDAVNDVADVPKAEFRTRDRSKELGPPSISLNPYIPEKERIAMAAILCPPSLASQEIYRPVKAGGMRSADRHLELHPPLRLRCCTEIQRIAEVIDQRGPTLGGGGESKHVFRQVDHDKWVQDRDFMPPKRRPDATPVSYVMSAGAYEDPLARKQRDSGLTSPSMKKSRSVSKEGRPLPKSYYCAINEISVAPPHVTSMLHAVSDDRSATAMQLVASRLQSRNCGTPSFPILAPKTQDMM